MFLRKWIQFTIITAVTSAAIAAPTSQPDANLSVLRQIRNDTQLILKTLDHLPVYIDSMFLLAKSWLSTEDSSKSLAVNGSLFSLLATIRPRDIQSQIELSKKSMRDYLGGDPLANYANDLNYTTLLGSPLVDVQDQKQLANSAQNYVTYASGSKISLRKPNPSWATKNLSQRDYYNFYNTFAAIQSFNSYVLSKPYAERQAQGNYPDGIPNHKAGDPASSQDILALTVANVSTPEWYAQVGSESLGMVLRQILIFNSQLFILFKQMLDTQQQLLIAQTMTNSLLMTSTSLSYGELLYSKASSGS